MKAYWWKILAVLIMVYVVLVGMITPMKPGITSVMPFIHEAGTEATLRIEGYNTHLLENSQAWLKLDSVSLIPAHSTTGISDNKAELTFRIPDRLPSSDSTTSATLLLSNAKDGTMVLPSAIVINQKNLDKAAAPFLSIHEVDFPLYEGFAFPYRSILNETVRNTFFHVAIWFAMYTVLLVGLIYSIKFLINPKMRSDIIASSFTEVGVLLGLLGIATGSMWAKFSWGAFWTPDIKLNTSASFILIYSAYLILRASITDQDRRARISAAYNIFAFASLIPLLIIIPRLASMDSLHPGNGGNPALGGEDLDNTLRMVFYPAIIGLSLLSVWVASLVTRFRLVKDHYMTQNAQ